MAPPGVVCFPVVVRLAISWLPPQRLPSVSTQHNSSKNARLTRDLSRECDMHYPKLSERALRLLASLITEVLSMMLLFPLLSSAQGGPVRDPAALTILQNNLAATGGVGVWSSIQDWTLIGTVSTSGSGQSSSNFSWIGSGVEFRMETDTGPATSVFYSGHGAPARSFNGDLSALHQFVARANPPFYLPGVCILQELNNQALTIQYVGGIQIHGTAAVQIHVSDDSNPESSLVTPHEWYFDASTFLPLEVQFRLPPNENAGDYLVGILDFWQFQVVGGLSVPSQTTISRANAPTKTVAVASVAFNSGVSPSTFDPPQGGGQ